MTDRAGEFAILDAGVRELHEVASNLDVFGAPPEWGATLTRRYDKIQPNEPRRVHDSPRTSMSPLRTFSI